MKLKEKHEAPLKSGSTGFNYREQNVRLLEYTIRGLRNVIYFAEFGSELARSHLPAGFRPYGCSTSSLILSETKPKLNLTPCHPQIFGLSNGFSFNCLNKTQHCIKA